MNDSTTYRFRANAFTGPRTFGLTGDALTWQEDGKPLDGVFYDQIAEVRLSYAPTRAATRRFRTQVILRAGGATELFNMSYRGFADFEDLSPAYAAFVTELHRRLAARGKDVRYRSGNTLLGFTVNLAIIALAFIALAAVVLLIPIAALPGLVILKLVIIAAFIPTLIRYMRRAKPATYDPLRIPPQMLP